MRGQLLFLILIGSTGCAGPSMRVPLRAPDPSGCYLIVYERPDYQGAGEVLNGPVRLSSLERLQLMNEPNWRSRIRSLRVGTSATVTAYSNAEFNGDSREFAPGTEHRRIEEALSGRIESLEVKCS